MHGPSSSYVFGRPEPSDYRSRNSVCQPSPAPCEPVMSVGALKPKIRHRPDATLADVMPTSAPAATSVSQWRLSLIRDQPTAVARPYRPTVAQGRWMSSASEVAIANEIEVWPEGKEAWPEN